MLVEAYICVQHSPAFPPLPADTCTGVPSAPFASSGPPGSCDGMDVCDYVCAPDWEANGGTTPETVTCNGAGNPWSGISPLALTCAGDGIACVWSVAAAMLVCCLVCCPLHP